MDERDRENVTSKNSSRKRRGNAPAPNEMFVAPIGENRVIVRFLDSDICQIAAKVMNDKQIRGNIIKAALHNDCLYKKLQWNEMDRKKSSSDKGTTKICRMHGNLWIEFQPFKGSGHLSDKKYSLC
ncbi:hypothetical protein K1T71_009152 [Dendrolimus kikuchii]|uniref:Uncharacterized protein n=1 Tax=Dendrolimus kikuchii TaxID=765133 RepID=A0ACC1CTY1_9NEOP|nr:hypothetical protein K1T71_009152 [Dendrolimus kikuchii]